MQDDSKEEFKVKVKASLDHNEQNLDADTRKRLADIRWLALNTQTRQAKPARWLALPVWLPSTSLAFGVLLALFFAMQHQQPSSTNAGLAQIAAFEMLSNADDLDALADPDFYLWADEALANEDGYAI
jgi:Protein of unknown function (DUF3619)